MVMVIVMVMVMVKEANYHNLKYLYKKNNKLLV